MLLQHSQSEQNLHLSGACALIFYWSVNFMTGGDASMSTSTYLSSTGRNSMLSKSILMLSGLTPLDTLRGSVKLSWI
jgi:hypothetical protein